jgi:hypothetical protein
MAHRVFGSTCLYEILGDLVVYRNLVPMDGRLPTLADIRGSESTIPRKAESEYAHVVVNMLRAARALEHPGREIGELIYIGDTLESDGTAFRNLCQAGGWKGWAFIGRDTLADPPSVQAKEGLYVANRWALLPDFVGFVAGQGFSLDVRTALVIDMDKTAIGARGRNDQVINEARVEGVRRTVADLLGPDFDLQAFRTAYDELNQSSYYGLTADNQDYLAYICLVLGAGLFDLDKVVRAVRSKEMSRFEDFIQEVHRRRSELAGSGLLSVHKEVWSCVQAGDPTPFKAFRYNEYLTTVERFDDQPDAPAESVLQNRIAITEEVRQGALTLRERGVVVFGLSDKPDEASLPRKDQAQAGMLPLHRLPTLSVGEL